MTSSIKVQVILDSDVLIHFIKGECLSLLPKILPSYAFVILDIVHERELASSHRVIIQNTVNLLKSISIVQWTPRTDERNEFLILQKKYGLGESAAMAYCKYRNNVLASSNLRDIVKYCEENGITYFTTMDFLYQAMVIKLMSEQDCNHFIETVTALGSRLPVSRMCDFVPRITL